MGFSERAAWPPRHSQHRTAAFSARPRGDKARGSGTKGRSCPGERVKSSARPPPRTGSTSLCELCQVGAAFGSHRAQLCLFHFLLKSGKLLFKATRKFCTFSTLVQAAAGSTVPTLSGKREKGADAFGLLSSVLCHPRKRGYLALGRNYLPVVPVCMG